MSKYIGPLVSHRLEKTADKEYTLYVDIDMDVSLHLTNTFKKDVIFKFFVDFCDGNKIEKYEKVIKDNEEFLFKGINVDKEFKKIRLKKIESIINIKIEVHSINPLKKEGGKWQNGFFKYSNEKEEKDQLLNSYVTDVTYPFELNISENEKNSIIIETSTITIISKNKNNEF